jgi:hypothetical protein
MVRLRTLPLRGPLRRRTANDSSFFVMDSDIFLWARSGGRDAPPRSHITDFFVWHKRNFSDPPVL